MKFFTESKQKFKNALQGIPFSLICLWVFTGLPLLGIYYFTLLFVKLHDYTAGLYNKLDDYIGDRRKNV